MGILPRTFPKGMDITKQQDTTQFSANFKVQLYFGPHTEEQRTAIEMSWIHRNVMAKKDARPWGNFSASSTYTSPVDGGFSSEANCRHSKYESCVHSDLAQGIYFGSRRAATADWGYLAQ